MDTQSPQPLDIGALIQALDRIAMKYDSERIVAGEDLQPETVAAQRELERTRALLLGHAPTGKALRDVRRLIASGLITWSIPIALIDNADSSLLLQSLVSATLWPLIIAHKLPDGWQYALQSITSPAIVHLIGRLRRARRHIPREELAQQLAERAITSPFIGGINQLLDDLRTDQGHAALIALARLRDGTTSKVATTTRVGVVKWILATAVGGLVGNRFDAVIVKLADDLQQHLIGATGAVSPAYTAMQPTMATAIPSPSPPTPSLLPPSPTPQIVTPTPVLVGETAQRMLTDPMVWERVKGPIIAIVIALLGAGGYYGARQYGEVAASTPTPTIIIPTTASSSSSTNARVPPPTQMSLTDTPAPPTTVPPPDGNEAHEAAMVSALNQYRHDHGCEVDLIPIAELTAAARRHSIDMATHNFLKQNGSDGSTPTSRADKAGFSNSVEEDIVAGSSDAQATLHRWIDDPSYQGPIMSCLVNVVGVGYAYSESSIYKHYWTIDFSRR